MRSVRTIHEKSLSARVVYPAWRLLHRAAALILRLRGKRPPLEDIISAWAGARWD